MQIGSPFHNCFTGYHLLPLARHTVPGEVSLGNRRGKGMNYLWADRVRGAGCEDHGGGGGFNCSIIASNRRQYLSHFLPSISQALNMLNAVGCSSEAWALEVEWNRLDWNLIRLLMRNIIVGRVLASPSLSFHIYKMELCPICTFRRIK